eukprot:m.64232 g.64232  ORF g.64232 m.64232 type:complete len:74 (+) comp13996_c0_seq9:379-600(+)
MEGLLFIGLASMVDKRAFLCSSKLAKDTALHVAAAKHSLDLCRRLVFDYGANPTLKNLVLSHLEVGSMAVDGI